MESRQRVGVIVGIAVVAVLALRWGVWQLGMRLADLLQADPIKTTAAVRTAHRAPVNGGRLFTQDETHAFLLAARKAEAIQDPLQRCLSYPDPPHSHWSPAAVEAYCRYHLQTIITFNEAQTLIQNGQAADLDRRLAQDLQSQLTKTESRGLLDLTYFVDFDNGSFDVRSTLDAWKRASPSSAFAYAASGWAYVAMAAKARGVAFIRDTPQENIDAMNRLLSQADSDLQRAIALNSKVTPAYVAMLTAGSLSLGDAYIRNVAKRGLAASPDDYAIYGLLSHAAEPKWGGSLQAMKQVAGAAQLHAKDNPLLTLLLSAEPAVEYDVCNCELSAQWAAYPVVFDNVSSTALLLNAGSAAGHAGHADLAAIYFSEALRFVPKNSMAHIRRSYALTSLGEAPWALEEANQQISESPQSAWGYSMRGYAYKWTGDYTHAAPDLEKAAALDPTNTFPLRQLGDIYTHTHDWDKAWDVANRSIQAHPQDAYGWILRASIQKDQPRAGLRDTIDHFLAQFGNDPNEAVPAAEMRRTLMQMNPQPGNAASASGNASHL